jgi:LmbE family N-acetylglucosaminyl deacetylase
MRNPLRILGIHAHPDDLEFQCAGTLALLRRAGHDVVMATMTPGDCGSSTLGPEAIADVRRAEARAAAEVIGASCVCLEFRDLAIFSDDDGRRRVTEAIRRARPDIVLTAPPIDYLADHEQTSLLVRDACFAAPAPNYATRQWDPAPALRSIPHLYFVDPLEGLDRDSRPVAPDFHVDVTAVYDVKRHMLACHASQREWLQVQHGIDEYLEALDRASARRGAEIAVERAEGFRQYLGHPYPASNLLLEAIGQDGRGGPWLELAVPPRPH